MAPEDAHVPTEYPTRLGKTARRALAVHGYTRYEQLTGISAGDLLRIHGVGPKAIRILREEGRDRGSVRLRMPLRTPRDKKRSSGLEGGLIAIPLFIIGGILAIVLVVVLLLGIDVLGRWMVSLIGPPILALVIGAALILLAGWGLSRMATGHALPGTSRRDKIVAAVTLIIAAVIGIVCVLYGIAPQAPGNPGF
jgi:hypothetical protein